MHPAIIQNLSVLVVTSGACVDALLALPSKFEDVEFVHRLDVAGALREIGQRSFDVIIIDHRVSGTGVNEFLRQVRILLPNCVPVLVSEADETLPGCEPSVAVRFNPNCLCVNDWNALSWGVSAALKQHVILKENSVLKEAVRKLSANVASVTPHSVKFESSASGESCSPSGAPEPLNLPPENALGLCFRLMSTFYPLLARQAKAVVEICRAMIQEQCFTDEERIVLSASSWIYDIGLVSMDRATVQKVMYREGECSDEERVLFRTHPIIGQRFAAFVNPLRGLGVTIRAHHERYDGMGYPDSLAGESIPWTARCLAVAVAFVETGLPKREAAVHLQEQSGRRFDPEAVRLFFKTNSIADLPANIREVLLADLKVGMRLARGIASPSGMLLIPSGRELDSVAISKIKNHSYLSLLAERILIYT